MSRRRRRLVFDGFIGGAAFESGDRLVVGRWLRSPLGSFADLMWARPDGRRVLITTGPTEGDFITSHYRFDETRLAPMRVRVDASRTEVEADEVRLQLALAPPGAVSAALRLRPRGLRTSPAWIAVEDALARPLAGPLLGGARNVRTRGVTEAGAREWYAIHDLRFASAAHASIGGVDLGAVDLHPEPARFGFSEIPPRPSLARVTSIIEEPD